MKPEDQIIPYSEVTALTGIGKTKLYEMRKAGQFPQPAQLGGRAAVWWLADIQQWLRARRAEVTFGPPQRGRTSTGAGGANCR
jgi:prophage regulatory protein